MSCADHDLLRCQKDLKKRANFLTRNASDAEDLVQETLVRAIVHREKFETGTNLKSWLYAIMFNYHVSLRRRLRFYGDMPENLDDRFSHTPNPLAFMELEELFNALNLLTPEQKTVILLLSDGSTYDDAAQELKIPVGTVKSAAKRGRQTLELFFKTR